MNLTAGRNFRDYILKDDLNEAEKSLYNGDCLVTDSEVKYAATPMGEV